MFCLKKGVISGPAASHRRSVDIDLFTDAPYGSIDFDAIDHFLHAHFPYVDASFGALPGMDRSYLVGTDQDNSIKPDAYYSTDLFLQPPHEEDGIRLATIDDMG